MRGLFLSGQDLYMCNPPLLHSWLPPSRISLALFVGTLHLLSFGLNLTALGDGNLTGSLFGVLGNGGSTVAFFWHLWSSITSWGLLGFRKRDLYMWLYGIWGNNRSRKIIPISPWLFFSPKATHKTTLSESRRKKHSHPQSCGDPQKNLSKPALLCSLLTTARPLVSSSSTFPLPSTSSSNPSVNYATFLVWTWISF